MADQQQQGTAVLRRALTDPQFRQRLTTDPKAALKEHGISVPEGVTVHVHEADAQTAHLVLPTLPAGKSAERMSDTELMQIAGGRSGTACFTVN